MCGSLPQSRRAWRNGAALDRRHEEARTVAKATDLDPFELYGCRMGYPFEDLDDSQFERLVVQISRKLFGMGVAGFAAGPDGGRDAKFVGTAEAFPSTREPWAGTTIIQAKHTIALNAHCSDPDFSGDGKSSVLTKELVRITKLIDQKGLDNYIVFTNRRLGAELNETLTARIAKDGGVKGGVFVAGTEYLNDMVSTFPEALKLAQIDPVCRASEFLAGPLCRS